MSDGLVFAICAEGGLRELVTGRVGRPSDKGLRGSINGLGFNQMATWSGYGSTCIFPAPRKAYSALSIVGQISNVTGKTSYAGFFGSVNSAITATGKFDLYDNNATTSMSAVQLYYNLHGDAWNTTKTVYIASTASTNAFPLWQGNRVLSASWDKDQNSGFGRAFYDGVEVARTGGTAFTGVSDWTQATGPEYLLFPTFTGAGNFMYLFERSLTPEDHLKLARNPRQLIM